MPDFLWSANSGRFRNAHTGRYLSSQQVRRVIDATLLSHTRAVTALTEQLRTRALSLPEWERRMRGEIKGIHVYSAMAGRGGRSQLTQSDFGKIGAAVKRQFRFLRRFADQIQSGKQAIDGVLVRRAKMYVAAGKSVSFEPMRQRVMRGLGFDQWRNELANSEHCEGENSCVEASAKGYQPIGEGFGFPGTRRCMQGCQCGVTYRNSQTGEIAA